MGKIGVSGKMKYIVMQISIFWYLAIDIFW